MITDYGHRFDEIAPGYDGPLYLEVVPLSFPIRVKQHLSLNQLRLMVGRSTLTDEELAARHRDDPILFRGRPRRRPPRSSRPPTGCSSASTSRATRAAGRLPGEEQRRPARHVAASAPTQVEDYWEPVRSEEGDRLVLEPERFYLLLSDESVMVPPDLAAEMTAYDPTSGELRTHYAGFFDPGFGYDPRPGSRGHGPPSRCGPTTCRS